MAENCDAAKSAPKLEGPQADSKDTGLSDLATVLLQEHDDVLNRRAHVRRLFPDEGAADAAGRAAAPSGSVPNAAKQTIKDYYALASTCEPGLSALCLSGGGIRSAAFGLGVIQGLSQLKLLHKFDYLSTVSGGGYIGSWLTSWVQRQGDGYQTVLRELPSNQPPDRTSPIGHLWRYSNYLTPRTGIFSTDLMTVATLYLRNLFLNWLVIIPIVVASIILIKLAAMAVWVVPPTWLGPITALSIAFVGSALLDSLLQRPGWEQQESNRAAFWSTETLPMAIGAFLASIAAILFFTDLTPRWRDTAITLALAVALLFALAWLIAFYFARFSPSRPDHIDPLPSVRISLADASQEGSIRIHVIWAGFAYVISGAIAGLVLAGVMWVVSGVAPDHRSILLVCFGLPIVVMSVFLADLVYSGLTSYAPWGDAEREWLARAGGRHTLISILWACAFGLVIFGSIAVFWLVAEGPKWALWYIASSGGVAAALIAILGKASATAAFVKNQFNWLDISIRTILAIAAPVFVATTVSLMSAAVDYSALSTAVDYLKFHEALQPHHIRCLADASCDPKLMILILSGTAFLGLSLIASLFVNVNRFSLHGIYRNRLIRAFLGASRRDRNPNPFTDFDDRDNIHLQDVWPMQPPQTNTFCPPQLLVVNMALNILKSKDLASQERKALPFTATARFVGSGNLPWIDAENKQRRGCFRLSRDYARGPEKGLTLGTVMTLSGAAASPNMGYHSSPALSLLLTIFNVRLGGWFGNPGPAGFKSPPHLIVRLVRWFCNLVPPGFRDRLCGGVGNRAPDRIVRFWNWLNNVRSFTRVGPTSSAMPLFYEALGITNDERPFVYLSDGGHFENLGIYEMIRRRCRYIIVSDAGNDPKCNFEDLGNAVRKASVDFGVKIDFKKLEIRARAKPPEAGVYAAVADIIYPTNESPPGKLLYVKPGFHGNEPASVRSYGELHPEFPHESTTDQWFSESQFEAYRALGEHVVMHLVAEEARPDPPDIGNFIRAV